MTALYSPYLAAIVLAWFLAHVVKYAVAAVSTRKKPAAFFGSGGMPSAHTATVSAVWVVILLIDGWSSGLFGLATALLLIVAYDAATLRRSVGQQRIILTELAKKSAISTGKVSPAKGHSAKEVVVGVIFGGGVGVVVYLVTAAWSW